MDDASLNPNSAQGIPPLPQEPKAPKPKNQGSLRPLFFPILLGATTAWLASHYYGMHRSHKSTELIESIRENYSIDLSRQTHQLQKTPLTHSNALSRMSERHGLELALLKNQWESSVLELKQEHRNRIIQAKNSHKEERVNKIRAFKAMEEDSSLWDGSQARSLRDKEWRDRSSRGVRFAQSPVEKAMLQMEAASTNAALPFQEVLKQVATLASPPGSRVDIKETSQGYFIRVAFALSKLNPDEQGAVTKHPHVESLRNEIEKCSAEVIRNLYEHCGTKRIAKIAVSCNHATRHPLSDFAQNDQERVILAKQSRAYMSCPFRCSVDNSTARQIGSWKTTPTSKIIALMKIEKDNVRDITITPSESRELDSSLTHPADPPLPLRFD